MAPPSANFDNIHPVIFPTHHTDNKGATSLSFPNPLKYSGSLDDYENFDVTAVIGREFPNCSSARFSMMISRFEI